MTFPSLSNRGRILSTGSGPHVRVWYLLRSYVRFFTWVDEVPCGPSVPIDKWGVVTCDSEELVPYLSLVRSRSETLNIVLDLPVRGIVKVES